MEARHDVHTPAYLSVVLILVACFSPLSRPRDFAILCIDLVLAKLHMQRIVPRLSRRFLSPGHFVCSEGTWRGRE